MRAGRWVAGAVVVGLVAAGCGSDAGEAGGPGTTAPRCPVEPVEVVVSVGQWADLARTLAGACAEVTTIVEGGDVDPHEFEPSPADVVAFDGADLVVLNGLGYDPWAEDAVDAVDGASVVVVAGDVAGSEEGDDPHIWYDPAAVGAVAAAVTDELAELAPGATAYLDERATEWEATWQGYLDELDAARAVTDGVPYAATETVFGATAAALGMDDRTPAGYVSASRNESDPAPGDLAAFEQLLRSGEVAVLVVNTQTEGSVPGQLRSVAEGAGIPVVEVTESVPSGADGFVAWQSAQLRALLAALGG